LRANFKQLKHFLSLSATAERFTSCALEDDKDWQKVRVLFDINFFITMLDKSQPNQWSTKKKTKPLEKNWP
jgi:hypothetical protein